MHILIQTLKVMLAAACLILTLTAKADSWRDPDWKQMLDSSDVIALVEYTSNGDFRASARILTIYKGQYKVGDNIWISGFSNRYGPIDKMSIGDKYLVFLNRYEPSESTIDYWNKELKKQPEVKDFVKALKERNVLYVWSPTSGDLKVRGNKVQYDLIQASYYKDQHYYPLN